MYKYTSFLMSCLLYIIFYVNMSYCIRIVQELKKRILSSGRKILGIISKQYKKFNHYIFLHLQFHNCQNYFHELFQSIIKLIKNWLMSSGYFRSIKGGKRCSCVERENWLNLPRGLSQYLSVVDLGINEF